MYKRYKQPELFNYSKIFMCIPKYTCAWLKVHSFYSWNRSPAHWTVAMEVMDAFSGTLKAETYMIAWPHHPIFLVSIANNTPEVSMVCLQGSLDSSTCWAQLISSWQYSRNFNLISLHSLCASISNVLSQLCSSCLQWSTKWRQPLIN